MKYFYFASGVIFFIGGIVWFGAFWRRLKQDFAAKMLTKNILKYQSGIDKSLYFSTPLIKKLMKKNIPFFTIDFSKNPFPEKSFSHLEWQAFLNPEQVLKKIKNFPKKTTEMLFLQAALNILLNDEEKAKKILENLEGRRLSNYQKAQKTLWESIFSLRYGDLMTASQNSVLAARLFEKEKAYYEMADAYLSAGNIYRISAGYDMAQLLFRNAEKLFAKLGAKHRQAEVLGYLGMLTAAQDRESEAEDYFNQAESIFNELNRKLEAAEINNQKALMFIGNNKIEKALALLKQIRFSARGYRYNLFCGLNFELESRACALKKKWIDSLSAAKKATELYLKTKNFSGYTEALFLQAQAYFEKKELQKAEKTCREIISFFEKHSCCFYIANVYSLLALIYLQQKDFSRAKTLLLQSVNQETRNNRFSGAAIDCANLALIESYCGHGDLSEENKTKALNYAQESGDEELYQILQNKFNKN